MTDSADALRQEQLSKLDTGVSHSARIWNYWLGGKDHFPVDREVGEQILSFVPELVRSAQADRSFLSRAVRYLAAEEGIRQFLDIGTGLPTADNTHEIAQRVAPQSRIVYVDNDPVVLVHARALLASAPVGATAYVDADVHEPEKIIKEAAGTLDLGQPVAVMMLGIVNFIIDTARAQVIIDRLMDAVPSGSYLVISHPTNEFETEAMTQALQYWNQQGSAEMRLRTRAELVRFFTWTDLVEPGVVSCTRWRPDSTDSAEIVDVTHFCGVGRKP